MYATETGKAQRFATFLADSLQDKMDVKVLSTDEYDANRLKDEGVVILITSTAGDGEPPESAIQFSEFLAQLASDETRVSRIFSHVK